MSEYSDLPEGVKKAIEELLQVLSGMTPEQIINLLADMFGEEVMEDLYDLILQEDHYTTIMDEPTLLNLEQLLEELEDFEQMLDTQEEVEPYYEISHKDNEFGEIIVEMPGLRSDSMIDWYQYDQEIFIYTVDGYEQYKIIIPLPDFYTVLEDEILYRNGLFIIPFIIS